MRETRRVFHILTETPSATTAAARSMDFVADALFDGRKIRCLTIVDNYSRKCMAIEVGQGLKGSDVVAVLEELRLFQQAMPRKIQVDHGSDLQSNHEHQIKQTQVNNLFQRRSIDGLRNIRRN